MAMTLFFSSGNSDGLKKCIIIEVGKHNLYAELWVNFQKFLSKLIC